MLFFFLRGGYFYSKRSHLFFPKLFLIHVALKRKMQILYDSDRINQLEPVLIARPRSEHPGCVTKLKHYIFFSPRAKFFSSHTLIPPTPGRRWTEWSQSQACRGRSPRSCWGRWNWRWRPWCGPRSSPLEKRRKETKEKKTSRNKNRYPLWAVCMTELFLSKQFPLQFFWRLK